MASIGVKTGVTLTPPVVVGLMSCKIYDQYFVKRCNKCQNFGHYYQECTQDQHICAKCGLNHPTNSCQSQEKKCTNCVKEGLQDEAVKHFAYDSQCPTLKKSQVIQRIPLGQARIMSKST